MHGVGLNFLIFSDSLTKGYYFRGYKNHPYSIQLSYLFKLSGKDVEIVTKGVNGEVTEDMSKRLKDIIPKEKFDLVILFGGANDIAYKKISVEDVLKNLFNMYQLCKDNDMKVVFITVPFAKYDQRDHLEEFSKKKREINQGIIDNCKQRGIEYLDMMKVFPVREMSEDLIKEIYDDDLHFTPKGYDTIGDKLYEIIKDY